MAVTKKDFPKRIYVYIDEDKDGKYLIACKTDKEAADMNESKLVGIYELENIGKLEVSVLIVAG